METISWNTVSGLWGGCDRKSGLTRKQFMVSGFRNKETGNWFAETVKSNPFAAP